MRQLTYLEGSVRVGRAPKAATFWVLVAFSAAFPLAEGLSNEYVPVGTRMFGMGVAFVWFVETCFVRSLRMSGALLGLWLYVGWNVVSQVWSVDYEASGERAVGVWTGLMLYWIVFDVATTEDRRRRLLLAYAIGVTALATTAMVNVVRGQGHLELSNRFSAVGTDPNSFGIMVVSVLPLIYGGMIRGAKGWCRGMGIGCACVCIVGALATGSRAAYVALMGVVCLALVINSGSWGQAGRAAGLGVVVLGMSYVFALYAVPSSAIERLVSPVGVGWNEGRLFVWQRALEFGMENPLTGVGAGALLAQMEQVTAEYVQGHSTFVASFAELGVVGCALWTGLWGWHFVALVRSSGAVRNLGDARGDMLLSLAVILVGALTLNWETRKPIFLLWGIIAAQSLRRSAAVTRERGVRRTMDYGGIAR